MKSFNRFLMMGLMLLMGVVSMACSESEEVDTDATKITLSVMPAEIAADGIAAAAFKVMTDLNTDVTMDAVITYGDGATVSGAKFLTTTAGTYTFKATYGNLTSNEVTVTATEAAGPDVPKENVWVTTEVCTPITYAEGNYYGTDTSVGIEVKAAERGKLQFVCTPGKEIKSYRVQYYSLSYIYNMLINQMNAEQKSELTAEDADKMILSFMTNFDYEALSGQLFNASDESLGENYGSYEFDWLNMEHTLPWAVQAGAEYLIVTLASFDEFCISEETYADMAICHVKTPEVPVVGNPEITIDVKVTYSSYTTTYTGNEDCAYMYFLSNITSEIEQYIEAYGDNMYRDFLRHYGSPVEMNEPYTKATSPSDILDKTADYVATAIALDVNGNPAETVTRKDFRLKEIPEGADYTLGTTNYTNFRVAATIAQFDVEMDMYTYYARFVQYTRAQAEEIMNSDESVKTALRSQMMYNLVGWANTNPNFKFDQENAIPVGDSGTVRYELIDLQPDTEYAFIYITRNGMGNFSELRMTESFTTKKLVRDQPELCNDIYYEFEATAPTVQSNRWTHKFDPDKVAKYWVYCYDPVRWEFYTYDDEGNETYAGYYTDPVTGITWYPPTPSGDRDTWLYWMIDYKDPEFGTPATMYIETTTDYQDGVESFELVGFDPGTTFKYAAIFESWDGVLSNIYYSECTTAEIKFGENPEFTYTYEVDENGNYEFFFTGNEDTGSIHYTGGGPELSDGLYLQDMYDGDTYYSQKQYINFGYKFCTEFALQSKGNTASMGVSARELEGKDIYVVLAIAEGAKDGNPVYSDLLYLVWTKDIQKFITVDEYFEKYFGK